ncbi:MAG: hypothetical protein QOJ49_224 [Actinomycetota bacterium]|jgi:uncharacterized membrane protein YgaE (UPF0421/DUF939 family)|nr:hypothetical protein [Actinomycetota bacterium]
MGVPEFIIARRGPVRLRGVRTAKTTAAAVAAFLVAIPVSSNHRPIVAPLTALLVVQLTLYDTLRTGLRRVASVVVGVLVAVGVSSVVPLTWWSLGLIIAGSLVLARLLHLGTQMLEVPISAMLVLAVNGSDTAAEGRVLETIVGAAVGVAVNALIAPPLYVRPASEAVQSLAGALADTLRRVSREVRGVYTLEQARAWLNAARDLGRDILRADRALAQAEESLRLNPRARRRRLAGRSLRSGLDALERSAVSLRGVCRTLAERVASEESETVYAEDVRIALSDLFTDLADAVDAYGGLIGSEVLGPGAEDAALREALGRAWEDRHRLANLLRQADRPQSGAWQLHGALAAQIDRMLRDLDSDARAELRATWPEPERAHPVQAARSRLRRASRADDED